MKPGTSIDEYISSLKAMQVELAGTSQAISDESHIIHLLSTLPESFDSITVFLKSHNTRKGPYQAGPGHSRTGKSDIQCWYCSKKGYVERECRSKQGDINKQKEEHGSDAVVIPSAQFAEVHGFAATSGGSSATWIIDSGASHHLS